LNRPTKMIATSGRLNVGPLPMRKQWRLNSA